MKLVLVCTAVVLLMSAVEPGRSSRRRKNPIELIFREADITPVPEEKVELYYGDYEVTLGMEVRPEDVQGLPVIVGLDFEPGCYYTVLKWTPDWPSSDDPFLSPYLLGLYCNVYENSDGCLLLEDSCEIATWLGPSPPPGTGTHHYVVYVFKQYEMIDTSDPDLCSYQTHRQNFSLSDFVKDYDLVTIPIGGCIFTSQYSQSEY